MKRARGRSEPCYWICRLPPPKPKRGRSPRLAHPPTPTPTIDRPFFKNKARTARNKQRWPPSVSSPPCARGSRPPRAAASSPARRRARPGEEEIDGLAAHPSTRARSLLYAKRAVALWSRSTCFGGVGETPRPPPPPSSLLLFPLPLTRPRPPQTRLPPRSVAAAIHPTPTGTREPPPRPTLTARCVSCRQQKERRESGEGEGADLAADADGAARACR